MTTFKDRSDVFAELGTKLTIAEIFETLIDGPVPIRFTAYDGSSTGPQDSNSAWRSSTRAGSTTSPTHPVIWAWPAPTSPVT